MLNVSYIEVSSGGVTARVYYDATLPADLTQPLVNGPRGYCLDVANPSGGTVRLTVAGLSVTVGKGDPVASGQGRSRTAAQMATLGYATRGSIAAMLE